MRNVLIGCIVLFAMAGTAFSEPKEPPKKVAVDLGGGVKMELVLIPAGEFKMGSGESAEETAAFFKKNYGMDFLTADFFKDEHPQHRVRITKPFYLGTYHVTRGQFRQFVKDSGLQDGRGEGRQSGGLWMGRREEDVRFQQGLFVAERGFRADRRAPGGQRKLERRSGLLQMAQQEGRQDLPTAYGGRVGIRLPGRDDDPLL